MSFTIVTVQIDERITGDVSGTGHAAGSITAQRTGVLIDGATGQVLEPVPDTVNLSGGTATMYLPATDDSGVTPSGVLYKWDIRIQGASLRTFSAALPHATSPVNLADLTPVTDSTHTWGLLSQNNLSDVASAATARTNLRLGTAAVQNVGAFAQVANNLSDVTAATALANLGGVSTSTFANVNRMPVLTVASSTASAKERALADYVCDGTADDVQINAAITALGGPGRVVLSLGTFTTAATISVPSGVVLEGQNRHATVITPANSTNLGAIISSDNFATLTGTTAWFVDTQNVRYGMQIRHLSVNGNKANQTGGNGRGIQLFAKNDIIDDVLVYDTYGDGIYHECGTTAGQHDYRDMPLTSIGHVWVRAAGGHGINYRGPHDGVIHWAEVALCGGDGIHVDNGGTVVVEWAHVYSCTGYGVYAGAYVEIGMLETEGNYNTGLYITSSASRSNVANLVAYAGGGGVSPGTQPVHLNIAGQYVTIGNAELGVQGAGSAAVLITANNVKFSGLLNQCQPTTAHIQLGTTGAPVKYCQVTANVYAAQGTVLLMQPDGVGNDVRIVAQVSGTATHWNGVKGDRDRVQYVGSGLQGQSRDAGIGTVQAGDTSAVVLHALLRTPQLDEISLTPQSSLGTATRYWVSNCTTTSFTVNVDAAPGAQGAVFGWRAELTEAVPLARDTFTRADGALGTAESGQSWTVDTGTVAIASGVATATALGSSHAVASLDSGATNLRLRARLNVGSRVSSAIQTASLIFRQQDASNFLRADIQILGNDLGVFQIIEYVAGSGTVKATRTITISPSTWYLLDVFVRTSSISASINGGNTISGSSSQFPTATRVGVHFYCDHVTLPTGWGVDDLVVTGAPPA